MWQTIIVVLILFPWIAIQVYYTYSLMPIPFTSSQKEIFFKKYIAFYEDFNALDKLLPRNASLLIDGARLGNVYVPRKAYLCEEDVNEIENVFLFSVGSSKNKPIAIKGINYLKGGVVYSNPNAISTTFRTPGQNPLRDSLRVYQLIRK